MIVFRNVDVETTGIPVETDRHALVEGAWCDVHRASDGDCTVMDPASMLCNPGRLIPVEAQAVHHIRDADVAGAPSPDLLCKAMGEGGDYFVAHNCSSLAVHLEIRPARVAGCSEPFPVGPAVLA